MYHIFIMLYFYFFVDNVIVNLVIALSLMTIIVIIIIIIGVYKRTNRAKTDQTADRTTPMINFNNLPILPDEEIEGYENEFLSASENQKSCKGPSLRMLRKNSLRVHLIGNPDSVDADKDIKSQVKVISYNTKREIERSSFKLKNEIGRGNFGTVHKGVLDGLDDKESKTVVAIKSLHSATDSQVVETFLGEIKIMSNLDPHLNLVNMIGSCTSEYTEKGKLWLLLEFCDYGDLRNYLITNKRKILFFDDPMNTRCLILWMYGIAKGMQYLAKHQIMHGDLAARNILLCKDPLQGEHRVPKIADFGLSKKFYDNMKYKKQLRPYVPWKWMALEYLTDTFFTLTSDVWSFAIVVWEVLSFGKEPYAFQKFDEVLDELQKGYRLSCPKECKHILSWSPERLYNKLSMACFVADPTDRATFSDVVALIEKDLSQEEIENYTQMSEKDQFIREANYIRHRKGSSTTRCISSKI